MAQYANENRQYYPTIISGDEQFPDFSFLAGGKLAQKQPNKEDSDGKKKQDFYDRNNILFQVDFNILMCIAFAKILIYNQIVDEPDFPKVDGCANDQTIKIKLAIGF